MRSVLASANLSFFLSLSAVLRSVMSLMLRSLAEGPAPRSPFRNPPHVLLCSYRSSSGCCTPFASSTPHASTAPGGQRLTSARHDSTSGALPFPHGGMPRHVRHDLAGAQQPRRGICALMKHALDCRDQRQRHSRAARSEERRHAGGCGRRTTCCAQQPCCHHHGPDPIPEAHSSGHFLRTTPGNSTNCLPCSKLISEASGVASVASRDNKCCRG